jgi:hypothetical protein
VNGLEKKDKRSEVAKVKCKEQVDEALRQYWDHGISLIEEYLMNNTFVV